MTLSVLRNVNRMLDVAVQPLPKPAHMPRKDAGGGPISAQAQQDLVSEGIENFELPKSLVTRIAKSAVSPSPVFRS